MVKKWGLIIPTFYVASVNGFQELHVPSYLPLGVSRLNGSLQAGGANYIEMPYGRGVFFLYSSDEDKMVVLANGAVSIVSRTKIDGTQNLYYEIPNSYGHVRISSNISTTLYAVAIQVVG